MANLFTIPQLLVGQNYRSNSISGEIISAETEGAGWLDLSDIPAETLLELELGLFNEGAL